MTYYTEGFVNTITYKGEKVAFTIRPTANYLASDIKGVTNTLLFVDKDGHVHNVSPELQFAVNGLMLQAVLQAKMTNLRLGVTVSNIDEDTIECVQITIL